MSEQVYVVPRADLFPGGAPHGFVRGVPWDRIYGRGRFAPRGAMEEDPSFKQVIPYAVVTSGREVFLFRRTRRGGERRLFGLRSIGVGGHVNPVDGGDVVRDALRRELEEELVLPERWESEVVGLLNDDTTAVGSVHVGVVARVEVFGALRVREADIMSGSLVSRADLLDLHARERASFESWSALLLDSLDEVLAWRPADSSTPTRSATRTSTT